MNNNIQNVEDFAPITTLFGKLSTGLIAVGIVIAGFTMMAYAIYSNFGEEEMRRGKKGIKWSMISAGICVCGGTIIKIFVALVKASGF